MNKDKRTHKRILAFLVITALSLLFVFGAWMMVEKINDFADTFLKEKNNKADKKSSIKDIVVQDIVDTESESDNQAEILDTDKKPETEVATFKSADILILNGGAPVGSAGEISSDLLEKGFTSVEAADSIEDYEGITIFYKKEELEATAVEIGEIMKENDWDLAELSNESSPESKNDAEIVVIVGS